MTRRPLDDHWLHDYAHLREMGLNDEAIATRFGITEAALTRRFSRMNNRPVLVPNPDPVTYPAPNDVEQLAEQSIEDAAEAICRVREESPHSLWADLAGMEPDRLYALVFALAAMVPDDRTVSDLLAWTALLAVAS